MSLWFLETKNKEKPLSQVLQFVISWEIQTLTHLLYLVFIAMIGRLLFRWGWNINQKCIISSGSFVTVITREQVRVFCPYSVVCFSLGFLSSDSSLFFPLSLCRWGIWVFSSCFSSSFLQHWESSCLETWVRTHALCIYCKGSQADQITCIQYIPFSLWVFNSPGFNSVGLVCLMLTVILRPSSK